MSGPLNLLLFSQQKSLLNFLILSFSFSSLFFIEEGSNSTNEFSIDSFVYIWLYLNKEQLLVSDTFLIHLDCVLLQHIVDISAMESSVELYIFFFRRLFVIITIILIAICGFFCSFLFSLLSVFFLISLYLVKFHDGFLVGFLATGEEDNSSEPLTCEDKLIPKTDPFECIEESEPKLKLFPVCEMVAPYFLQHGVHSMILLITPS